MLALSETELEERAKEVIAQVTSTDLKLSLEPGDSAVGGGTAPTSKLKSILIALTHPQKSAAELEQQLRRSMPPVIARVADEKVLIDLRTVFPDDLSSLIAALKRL
jgi:L-seryl-tRNA(Ser) seleniumtransferase